METRRRGDAEMGKRKKSKRKQKISISPFLRVAYYATLKYVRQAENDLVNVWAA
jgi:hypothetical protein